MFGALKKKFTSFFGKVEKKEEEKVKEESPLKEKDIKAEKARQVADEKENAKKEKEKESKIRVSLGKKVMGFVTGKVKISENDIDEFLTDLQMDLISGDVAVDTSDRIIEDIRTRVSGKEVKPGDVRSFIKESVRAALLDILTPKENIFRDNSLVGYIREIMKDHKPVVIVFFGVNGTGKTTTIAKFASYLKNENLTVIAAAADTFRAGAIEQLVRHGENIGIRVIKHQKGSDAAAVIFDAIKHAQAKGIDVVLADTAGRMQTNVNLMGEMQKICRVNKPDIKIFVGDSLTGNDAIEQAQTFNDSVGIDGAILTKADADAQGGSALSIAYQIGKPIVMIGVGQSYEDIKPFDREWFVGQILD